MIFSGFVITGFILLVLASLAGFIWFGAFLRKLTPLKDDPVWISFLSSILSVVSIFILSSIYRRVAEYLNNIENYKYETKYMDALIGKNFLFDFINLYGTLTWIGIVRPLIPQKIEIFGQNGDVFECGGVSCITYVYQGV